MKISSECWLVGSILTPVNSDSKSLLILSDVHYAGPSEQNRRGYESRAVPNWFLRLIVHFYRDYIWLKDPFAHNHLLDQVLSPPIEPDLVIGNGDYSCDSAFIGVADDAACESAQICLGKLRNRFGARFHSTIGDHELGKLSLFGARGGLRLASFERAQETLQLKPFWQLDLGRYALIGITSTLVAFPVYEKEAPSIEHPEWHRLRELHLNEIRQAFEALSSDRRIILFTHDPTSLPFLWREPAVQKKCPQIDRTIIGHLHTNMVLRRSKMLAGMPRITFLGHAIRRMSSALNEAKHWKPFNVLLCPSLSGTELHKDGGYFTALVDPEGREPVKFSFQKIHW